MENPSNRPPAAQFINEVINKHRQNQANGVIGWSLAMAIYDALKREGYLIEGCPCPYDCDGCHEGDGICWRGNPDLWSDDE